MKTLRIPLVIVLVVVGGRTFDAGAQMVTILHSFAGSPSDGNYPYAGLVQGSDGNFYGTTQIGGTYNSGTVFQITARWLEQTDFCAMQLPTTAAIQSLPGFGSK